MKQFLLYGSFLTLLIFFPIAGLSADYHVAKTGSDKNSGSIDSPFITINHAASVANAGDKIIVHSGTYREWVNPLRGGESPSKRITYIAASGEKVIVKGSEQISSWVNQGNSVWKAELDNAFFKGYNPFALQVKAAWMKYGEWHHRGAVYLNGVAFYEKASLNGVKDSINAWFSEVSVENTTIWANFGESDPNKELTEINARESIIFPKTPRLRYITISGLTIQQAAPNWGPPGAEQIGAIGPNFGFNWIIENCKITDSRCLGISIGFLPGIKDVYQNIDSVGHHIIRNNIIQRCGQSGIAGHNGCMASEIYGNLIEETNYLKEFGGWETAALKFHKGIDMYIHNNCIRGVYKNGVGGAFGIWIDTGTQGMRISSNVIAGCTDESLYFESNHGPILIDNNIIIGGGCHQRSEAGVFVHNLFIDCKTIFTYEDFENEAGVKTGARQMEIYEPHTSKTIINLAMSLRNDRWFNNIFIKFGLDKTPQAEGFRLDNNVFLNGAKPSQWADVNSLTDTTDLIYNIISNEDKVEISITIPKSVFQLKNPLITDEFIGKFPYTNQRIETINGDPIIVDRDYFGKLFPKPNPVAGPFSSLRAGINHMVLWKVNN